MKAIVELILQEDEDGVYAISLVESPAIQENFIALSKEHKIEFKEVERNLILGAVLIPDMLIDRKSKDGEIFQIFLSGETITKVAHKYMQQGNQSNITLQHKSDVKGVTVVETWLKEDAVHDKSVKYGFDYPLNTWLVAMKVEDQEIKNKIISGEIKGFSIEGIFKEAEEKLTLNKLEMEYKQTLNKVKALLQMEVKLEQVKLVDGVTTLEAESFEAGYSIGIVTEEGAIPAPVGEYETTDGNIIVVEVEGQIKEIKAKEAAPEEVKEPEMGAQVAKKTVETVSKETFFEEVKAEIETLTNENKSLKAELSALKIELSEASAKAIVPNPEKKSVQKTYEQMTNLEKTKFNRGLI